MAPEFGVTELPFTNDSFNKSKEMEAEDIEDGEILEDESNPGDQTFLNKDEPPEELPSDRLEVKNSFEKFFHKDKKNYPDHPESHKPFRRERSSFSDSLKKRKRIDRIDRDEAFRNEKYYGKKSKREDELEDEDEMIFMLGGSVRETERRVKHLKAPVLPDPPDELLDPPLYNEGENEDPRPYSKRSPARLNKLKKDRGVVRGINVGLLKRRGGGRGGAVMRKDKPREPSNDVCHFFAQGNCQRGSDCPYLHSFNHPRKLEVCKFYLKDCCNKRDNCIYMHSDFPCKYFHTPGSTCYLDKSCKFSHGKLDEVQRAVLKKYADIQIKELDEMQRYYREMYASRNNKEKKDANLRIPSLFDIKVSMPPEYRGTEDILNEDVEGDGVTTPIPSPQSMMCENTESEERQSPVSKHHHHQHYHHHKHKILSEQNDHRRETSAENDSDAVRYRCGGSADEVLSTKSHHKKRSKKSTDEYSDGEHSKKHSEKRKKKSKKEDKDGEREKRKKKKKEHRRNRGAEQVDEFGESANRVAARSDSALDDSFEMSSEDRSDREPADALSRLPKKQQELFLRIQQHQKEADTSQNSNVDEDADDDDAKADVNWYSSDEEEPAPSRETESESLLTTLLRTIQTTSNVPSAEPRPDDVPTLTNLFSAPSIAPAGGDPLPIVDESQLANIALSDEVTKLLSSIMKTDTTSGSSETISNSLPSATDKDERLLSTTRKPFDSRTYIIEKTMVSSALRKPSVEDIDFRFPNVNLIAGSLFSGADASPKDIDLRQLPFKPIPVHDAANEIDASITSHPPMEYKLTPLPFIARVNYASMSDLAKICANDPRFKRRAVVGPEPTPEPQLPSAFNPNDPRYLLAVKSHETVLATTAGRADPRLADPRNRVDPRLDGKHNMPAAATTPAAAIVPDQRLLAADKEPLPRVADFRDPRLTSRNKLPEPPMAYAVPSPVLVPPACPKELMPPLRKEDPRLRFRANQNV